MQEARNEREREAAEVRDGDGGPAVCDCIKLVSCVCYVLLLLCFVMRLLCVLLDDFRSVAVL